MAIMTMTTMINKDSFIDYLFRIQHHFFNFYEHKRKRNGSFVDHWVFIFVLLWV